MECPRAFWLPCDLVPRPTRNCCFCPAQIILPAIPPDFLPPPPFPFPFFPPPPPHPHPGGRYDKEKDKTSTRSRSGSMLRAKEVGSVVMPRNSLLCPHRTCTTVRSGTQLEINGDGVADMTLPKVTYALALFICHWPRGLPAGWLLAGSSPSAGWAGFHCRIAGHAEPCGTDMSASNNISSVVGVWPLCTWSMACQ